MASASRQPRIQIVCGQPLPLGGVAATGVGLRAWAIGQGLQAHRIEVVYAVPHDILPKTPVLSPEVPVCSFAYHELDRCVDQVDPTVVLLMGWPWANMMTPRPDVPVVIDLTGPYLIENLYSRFQDPALMPWLKLKALQKADFLICGGDRQRHYFLPWLMMAGYDIFQPSLEVVHIALDPVLPEPALPDEPTFVHGGIFLPWQDPSTILRQLVSKLEKRKKGRLVIIGGAHPAYTFPTGNTASLVQELEHHPRVEFTGLIAHEALIARYLKGSVAVDLMERNPERELAFPNRTVVALWCGLPVIFNDYSELSSYIRDYQAGWTLTPGDAERLDRVIDTVLDNPDMVRILKGNAQRLVRERFTWDKTVLPLVEYCRTPSRRTRHPSMLEQSITPLDDRMGRMMVKLKHSSLYHALKSVKNHMAFSK